MARSLFFIYANSFYYLIRFPLFDYIITNMASIFCPHCGSKAEYKFSPPNFCYKCGMSYGGISTSVQKHKQVSRSRRSQVEDADDDVEYESEEDEVGESYFSNSTRVPRISKLSVEIDTSSDVRVVKFSDLMSPSYETSQFPRGKTQNLSDLSND